MTFTWVQQPVELIIQGPVLTAGETFSSWGTDSSFYRDFNGRLALPGSHVRGKLREALKDVLSLEGISEDFLARWFGKESNKDTGIPDAYSPHRGVLKITDFLIPKEAAPLDQVLTRIRIEPETGVVSQGALMAFETPFSSGKETHWHGFVEFFSAPEEIGMTLEYLKKAFCFISALGREKTIGFGRLTKVVFGEKIQSLPESPLAEEYIYPGLKIAIKPEEAFMIGGVRHNQNVFKSDAVISGKVIKGAFATGLNRIAGNDNLSLIIDGNNKKVSALYPELAEYFGELVINHAIPCLEEYNRPCTIPLSVVKYGDRHEDVTFLSPEDIFSENEQPVTFQVDWKKTPDSIPKKYILPDLEYFPVTRTAIEYETRRADEGKLYSFHMIKPFINESTQVCWNSRIIFPQGLEPAKHLALAGQIRAAFPLALKYLGKRQSRVTVMNCPEKGPAPDYHITPGSRFAVILQTQALMINPESMAECAQPCFDDRDSLHRLYQEFWDTVWGADTVKLSHFYATQELQGGYLGVRFNPKQYSPFYLTSKGSVFVFKACSEKINILLNKILRSGLPLPGWVGEPKGPRHPFAPQNGFGEIKIIMEKGGDK